MALETLISSLNIKIVDTASPQIAGPTGDGFEKHTNQTGIFIWATADVNVLGRNMIDTEWTIIEHLSSTNKNAIVNWDDYEIIAFQSQSGNQEKVRLIPRYDNLVETSSDPIVVPRINKFSDLTDVPAYTAADDGKVFKVEAGGNLVLTLPPNFNTQATSFPHIEQLSELFNKNTSISNARLGNTSLSTGLLIENAEEHGTLNSSGVELSAVSSPELLASNALIRNNDSPGTLSASRGNTVTGHTCALPINEDYVFGTSDFTIAFWAKIPTNNQGLYLFQTKAWSIGGNNGRGTNYMEIYCTKPDAANPYTYQKQGGGTIDVWPGSLSFRAWGYISGKIKLNGYGGMLVNTGPEVDYCDNQWHHYTFIRSGDDFSIYIDGQNITTQTWLDVNFDRPDNNQVYILGGVYTSVASGAHTNNPPPSGAKLEQYCIWNRAITTEEIGLLNHNLESIGSFNTAVAAEGQFDVVVEGNNFESSSKIYIYHEDGTVHNYEDRATANFTMYGDYTGNASLKTSSDNITILETNNLILLSEFVEDANEFSGKIPFVFINKTQMRIRIVPQTAGNYTLVVWNTDGNKCVLKNCLTLT